MPYASGKNAWGISDRSGRRYRLREMQVEWTGAKVGPDEFDPKHPQLFLLKLLPIRRLFVIHDQIKQKHYRCTLTLRPSKRLHWSVFVR